MEGWGGEEVRGRRTLHAYTIVIYLQDETDKTGAKRFISVRNAIWLITINTNRTHPYYRLDLPLHEYSTPLSPYHSGFIICDRRNEKETNSSCRVVSKGCYLSRTSYVLDICRHLVP